jgi:uncharacterized protein
MTEPHDITVRKVKFEFPDDLDEVLPGNDVVRETYMVAFSLTMPYLEPYLIRTFRAVADDITDAGLAADVREFIGQEAQHFQNHRRINEIIKRQLGPAVAAELQAVEDRLDADYRRFNTSKSRRFNLVYAEGFEAMTCAMALTSIAEAEAGSSSIPPGPWGELWAWHLAEEMEHRTVAFDLYEHLEGSYAHRVIGSLRAQWHFQRTIDRLADVAGDVDELVVADSDRVVGVDVLREAVLDAAHLGFEGAEQLVPDDEDAAVVLVEVLLVGAVVDPVVRGGVEHGLGGRGEPVDRLGVDPVLVEQVELAGLADGGGVVSEQRHRPEHPPHEER